MFDKKEIIQEIKKFNEKIERKNKFFFQILSSLGGFYEKLDKTISIDDYSISSKEHYMSIRKNDEEYLLFINLTRQFLELRLPNFEQMFFLDNSDFVNYFNLLLDSFFNGKYIITINKNVKGKIELKEINWEKKELQCFNQNYKIRRSKDFSIIEKFNGIQLV